MEALKEQIFEAFSHLHPEFVESYDTSFSIFSDQYKIFEGPALGQRVLADFLRPLPRGQVDKKLKLYIKEPVNFTSETECEVTFLFKWE